MHLSLMISIIVPIYNAGAFLPRCIDSLLAQTTTEPLQILLVDDESTDQSLSIMKSYAGRDSRITVLTQKHAGQSVARNLAMLHAEGEFIAFVDADDALEPEWCEVHLAAITGVDYVQSGYKRVSLDGKPLKGMAAKGKLPVYKHQFTAPWARLYRRAAIQDLRFAEGYIYEDVLFSADLWLTGARCRIIPYTGYLYTLTPYSTTAQRHPEDEQRLFTALRAKTTGQTLRNKLIIRHLINTLKFYFLRS
ncbi:MAG: glycosyltransferase [Paludibacteraceae bacterium]|nr:glycosyltransferase [Paludibacteraceae bacterium]